MILKTIRMCLTKSFSVKHPPSWQMQIKEFFHVDECNPGALDQPAAGRNIWRCCWRLLLTPASWIDVESSLKSVNVVMSSFSGNLRTERDIDNLGKFYTEFSKRSTQHVYLDWVEITAERMHTGDLKTQSKPPTAALSAHSLTARLHQGVSSVPIRLTLQFSYTLQLVVYVKY